MKVTQISGGYVIEAHRPGEWVEIITTISNENVITFGQSDV